MINPLNRMLCGHEWTSTINLTSVEVVSQSKILVVCLKTYFHFPHADLICSTTNGNDFNLFEVAQYDIKHKLFKRQENTPTRV